MQLCSNLLSNNQYANMDVRLGNFVSVAVFHWAQAYMRTSGLAPAFVYTVGHKHLMPIILLSLVKILLNSIENKWRQG